MRHRILVTIVAITTLAVLGFAIPLAVAVADTYWNAARLGLQREAAAATTEIPASFPDNTDPTELPPADEGTSLALYGADGRLLSGEGPATADAIVQQALAGHAADGRVGDEVVAAVPVATDENVTGAIRAAQPDTDIEARIWRARAVMAALALIVVATAAAIATWQARRLSRPLDHLAVAAQRLGDGDFTVRNEPSGFDEIDAAGLAMDRTAQRLGTLIARERSFSADVSHQLRTPLTSLRLDLENGLATPGVDKTQAIERALDSIDSLEATIEDLIALARDTGHDQDPLDVTAIFAEIDEDWRRPLAEQSRRLNITAPIDLPPLAVSAAAVRQIMAVLLANSAEHGDGTVTVAARPTPTGLIIEVSDEGPGIPGDPETAFLRRADRTSGRGIGLALARSLAEAEGGGLTYLNGPEPRFVLLLRRDSAAAPPRA